MAHLEFSVLHEMVDAVSVDAKLSGVSLLYCREEGVIATKVSEDRRLKDTLVVNGVGG